MLADETEHPDRSRPDLERREQPRLETEREQLLFLGILRRAHRLAIDHSSLEHLVENGARHRTGRTARENALHTASRRGHHLGAVTLDEDDRQPLEGNE